MSGTSHPSVMYENGHEPAGFASAKNVLVLDDPRVPTTVDHFGPELVTDGPLLLVAFTAADVQLLEGQEHRELYVVDATPQGNVVDEDADGITVESVSSPANLTEIGVALDKLLARAGDTSGRLDCCLPSLTALLQYVDRQRAYRFCNAMTNRLASADAFAHYHLSAEAHDDMTVDTFASLMDAVVRVDADGSSVVRSR